MVILEQNILSAHLYRGLGSKSAYKLQIDSWSCIGCMLCVSACPLSAFGADGDDLVFYPNACDMEGNCALACPTGALAFLSPEDVGDCLNQPEYQAEPCADLISIDTISGSTGLIERTYKWMIYKNLFNLWYYS